MGTISNTKLVVLLLSFLSPFSTKFYGQTVEHQVYLMGNFVDVEDKPEYLTQLKSVIGGSKAPFTLILNGDLVDRKMGESNHDDLLVPIRSLADMLQEFPDGQLIVVPGDRDWNRGQKGGEKSLENLESRIKKYFKKQDYDNCHWAIKDGCPGPETFEVGDALLIATLNTQWWNHPYDKPRATDALCGGLTAENLKEEIEDVVEEYQDWNVLIVGHHPVVSLGNYGGYFSVASHFVPLPVIGSFKNAFHAHAGNQYDLANERIQVFIESMNNLLYFHENLIYASGHEKNQQVISAWGNYLVNSGAPTQAKYATRNQHTLLSKNEPGIMAIEYYDDGKVNVQHINWEKENNQFGEEETLTILHSSCSESIVDNSKKNHAYVPCKGKMKATEKMLRKYTEPTRLVPGPEYKAGWWKRIWFGHHYRTTWTEEVEVPYLDLDETHGGLTIYKKGGGRQTTSLKFKSGNGTEYTFRSVNKDPSKALNYKLRNTFAKSVVRDQTSTQQPYGAMVAASLLDEVGILHAMPILYRLPDDPKLGPFRSKYGNLFGMLEENPGKPNNKGVLFGEADKIHKSTKMFKEFYEEQKTKINQEEFVRARLFDILVGDWSKHEDNWKWAAYDEDGFRIYRPIPRDRDHVFSRQDGFINWLADRPFGIQNIENFGAKFTGVKSLTFQARHMDRFLMQEATKEMFLEQAKFIQNNISDKDIEKAVAKMPQEIYGLSGNEIENKLKSRLPNLHQAAEEYYGYLSKEVDVLGSKDEEYFEIIYGEDGFLTVKIFDVKKDEKGDLLLFERTFNADETREVRLWGLGDDDIFNFSGKKSKIKVRAFGGPGDDQFIGDAEAKTLLYDKGDNTSYEIKGKEKIVNHWNKELYEYDRMRFEYNYSLPIIYVAYSGVTGFGFNFGRNFTVRRFHKDLYHSTHKIGFGLTSEGNKNFSYAGRFHQAIRKWDFLGNVSYDDPVIRNRFYGLGNGTENLESDLGRDFYQTKIKSLKTEIGLVRDFWQKSYFQFTVGFEQNESQQIDNTFLNENFEDIYGAHQELELVPLQVTLDLDFRDEKGLPYRGTRAVITYENTSVLTDVEESSSYGILRGDIEYYLSTRRKHPLTLGLRLGGAISHDDIPWYKQPTLGSDYGLRGFVEQRFVAKNSAFLNTELRYQFVEKETSFIPIKAGFKVFYDVGRVSTGVGIEDDSWKSGYGFGFYLVPLDETITIALSMGFSEEESSGYPIFSIGKALR